MPADDHPFDALEKQLQLERLSVSPVSEAMLRIASLVKVAWPFDKAVDTLKSHVAADSLEKVRLMLETCMTQVRKLDVEVGQLRARGGAAESQRRESVAGELLLDAARRAASTRAKERVKRIGLILGNAIVESGATDADEVEEMMRVAVELGDRDIRYLKELVRIEGDVLQTQTHIPRYDAHNKWEQGWWRNSVDPEIDSVFSKLESYGLVARIAPSNNENIMSDFQNRYVLLKKGLRFVTLAREAAATG
jgi:hypothetical protein